MHHASNRLHCCDVDRNGYITFAPIEDGQPGSELFDTCHSADRIRPRDERRRQTFAIRKQFGAPDGGEASEDLVDVGEDDDGEAWAVTRTLCYRWCKGEAGRSLTG